MKAGGNKSVAFELRRILCVPGLLFLGLLLVYLSSCSKGSESNPERILELSLSDPLKAADSVVIYIQDAENGEKLQTLYEGQTNWNKRDFSLNKSIPSKYEIVVLAFDAEGKLLYFKVYNENINIKTDVYNTNIQADFTITPLDTIVFEGDSIMFSLDSIESSPNHVFWFLGNELIQSGGDSLLLKDIPRKWTGLYVYAKIAKAEGMMESPHALLTVRGIPTDVPSSPIPENGATDQPVILDLSWTTIPPVDNGILVFDVYLDEKNPPAIVVSSGQSDVKYYASNLKQNTQYYWKVVASQSNEIVEGPVWSFTTKQSPLNNTSAPNVPSDPSPSDNSENQNPINLTLRWTGGDLNPLDLVKYDVLLGNENPPQSKITQSLITNQFNINFLEHGKTYYWQVTASDGMATTFGPVWKFSTAQAEGNNQAPLVPNSPNPPNSATNQEISGLELFWKGGDPDEDNVVYTVFYGTSNPPNQNSIANLSTTRYTLGSLNENTIYYWYVVSNDGSAITIGPTWKFTTKQPDPNNTAPYVPSAPIPPDSSKNMPLNFKLGWSGGDPDEDDITRYDLFLGFESPPTTQEAIGIEDNSLNISGLEPGKNYYWRILASDGNNTTEGPVWRFTTNTVDQSNPAPGKPQIVLPADGETDLSIPVDLAWICEDENGDPLSYNVLIGTTNPPPQKIGNPISQTTRRISNLEEGTTYYWRVVATDGNQTTVGDVWSFTTAIPEILNSPPIEPSAPNPSNEAVDIPLNLTISWEGGDPDAGDVVSYDIYLDESPNPTTKKASVTENKFTVVGLANGITYYWKVVASDGKEITSSPIWQFTSREIEGQTGLFYEYWNSLANVPFSYLYLDNKDYLTEYFRYPDRPDDEGINDKFEAQEIFSNTFGIRYRGYIHPPSTGEYTFWVAANDYGELWLSSNTSPTNIGDNPICYTSYFTAARDWEARPSQKSEPVYLIGGQEYYLEAFYIQGSGGTNFAVGWQGPGITGNLERPIPGHRLSPWTGVSLSPPTITAHPQTNQVRPGQSATFSVEATSNSGLLKYQWRKNGVLIDGATGSSHTTNATVFSDDSSSFDVIVSNDDGSVTSQQAELILIYIAPVLRSDIEDQTVSVGENVTFTASLAAGDNPTFTWFFNGSEVISGKDSTFTINNVNFGHNQSSIQVVVSNKEGSESSNSATLYVKDIPPEIIAQPIPASVREGDSLSFSVTSAGTNLSYQWFVNGTAIQSGGNSDTYKISAATNQDNGKEFFVAVYNSADTVHSDTVTLAVTPFGDPPQILENPEALSVMVGENAQFEISASGTDLNFQWFLEDSMLIGSNDSILILSQVQKSDSGKAVTCLVWNLLDSLESPAVELTVIDTLPRIITQPFGDNIIVGESPSFLVVAQGSNLSYQWYRNNLAIATNGNSSSYNGPVVSLTDNNNSYFVEISNSTGTVSSDTVILGVSDLAPNIQTIPSPQIVNNGNSATISATVSGTNLVYQWYYSANNNGSWTEISGANGSSYTSNILNATHDGSAYRLIASNSAGSDTSNTVVIDVQ